MSSLARTSARLWRAMPAIGQSPALIHACAGLSLACLLWLNALIWPIGTLGHALDWRTGTIVEVDSGSSADKAGIRVGDRLVELYGRPFDEVASSWNALTMVPPAGAYISATIERAGERQALSILHTPPDASFQQTKIANLLLALLCWLVGYLLGIARRGEASAQPLVALFWLGVAAVFGGYVFAAYASLPLQALLQWTIIAAVMPAAVSIHVWFPARMVAPPATRRAWRLALAWEVVAHGFLLAALTVYRPRLPELIFAFSTIVPVVVLMGVLISGTMLWRAQRRTPIAHVRRQVRLILLACMLVALLWSLAFSLPYVFDQPIWLADQRLNVIVGVIPLAYLVGGVWHDLFRIERALQRLISHLATIALLFVGLSLATSMLQPYANVVSLWAVVLFVTAYQPIHRLIRRVFPANDPEYRALNTAVTRLTTTLDAVSLTNYIVDGVRATFDQPALAFYSGDIDGTNSLRLVVQERLPYLPETIPPGCMTQNMTDSRTLIGSRDLAAAAGRNTLHVDEERALRAPGVVLWCPMVHHDGHLLGLLVLGMRGDFDPYREQDLNELRRLSDAAALALTNSAAYDQQLRAEATIHDLYEHLQHVQDDTAKRIARELHDEVITTNMRPMVRELEQLLLRATDGELRKTVQKLLEFQGESTKIIRDICEILHPTMLDDPCGLNGILRVLVDRADAQRVTRCDLNILGDACPLGTRVQREAMRITREALANALNHAGATRIGVTLRYPDRPDEPVEIRIQDNGRGAQRIMPRIGGWGVRNMYESARMIGGELTIDSLPGSGTAVILRFHADDAAWHEVEHAAQHDLVSSMSPVSTVSPD